MNGITGPKGIADHKHTHSSKKILYPLLIINVDKGGIFKRIEWEEALDIIVGKLKELLSNRHSILFMNHTGSRELITRHAFRGLWNYLGVVRIDDSICDVNDAKALKLLYGFTYDIFPREMYSLRMVVIWGFNPFANVIYIFHKLLDIKRKGGFIVTIDVRYSETVGYAIFYNAETR